MIHSFFNLYRSNQQIGNMTYDLDRNICAIKYNLLNLPDTIQFANGNLIVHQHDALGNVRETYMGSTNTSFTRVQQMQYYPSGLPWNDNYQPSQQPYKYGGKEFVEMHGLDEYDSQARWYYPALMRTTTQDPLAEKYYDISPYAWCANNPVNLVDPDGMSPIFNRMGSLIGTDEYGLTGEAIIMDEKFFTQGMSFSEASFFNLGIEGLENDQALKKYNESCENLSARPDYDGFITDLEARSWWTERRKGSSYRGWRG